MAELLICPTIPYLVVSSHHHHHHHHHSELGMVRSLTALSIDQTLSWLDHVRIIFDTSIIRLSFVVI
jgi:integral membrane sensor domain MASE1